ASPTSARGPIAKSPQPTTTAPDIATPIPVHWARVGRSWSSSAESAATMKGCRLTSTTELATVVKRSEAIQLQKWPARSRPEATARIHSRGVRRTPFSTEPRDASTTPIRSIEKTSRHAATDRAGASASRTSGPAQETASIATTSAAHGDGPRGTAAGGGAGGVAGGVAGGFTERRWGGPVTGGRSPLTATIPDRPATRTIVGPVGRVAHDRDGRRHIRARTFALAPPSRPPLSAVRGRHA